MKTPQQQQVLCFERKAFDQIGVFQGLNFDIRRYSPLLDSLVAVDRTAAESDESYKQIIPYIIVRNLNRILIYRRGKAGNESRLHGSYSIGIGGHVEPSDSGYLDGAMRELDEEIGSHSQPSVPIAFLNDDSAAVGRVHFGVVHFVDVDSATIKCASIEDAQFVHPDKINPELLESWSQFCLPIFQTL